MPSPARTLAGLAGAGLPVVRPIVHAGLGRVFGPPPFDPESSPGDPGLFGPGSASWQVVGEPAAIVGGVRALLVQLLHPLAMAGVADHSAFRDDALGRLHRTSAYVTATTFGSFDEVLAAARRVRGVHRPVSGTAPGGRPYRAADPHLLAWVGIAFTSSLLVTDRAYAPHPVRGARADAFVAEQSRGAALLDPRVDLRRFATDEARDALRRGEVSLPMLDDGLLPRTVAELRGRLDDYAGELGVDDQGREALRFLLWPDVPPPVRAGYLPLLAGAAATLDREQRRLLGIDALGVLGPGVRLQTRALLASMRLVAGVSPSRRAAHRRATADRPASGRRTPPPPAATPGQPPPG
jgi:uncharacterized protein (DUF2236 family)